MLGTREESRSNVVKPYTKPGYYIRDMIALEINIDKSQVMRVSRTE